MMAASLDGAKRGGKMAMQSLDGLADLGLVERVRGGDDDAFAEIVRRHDRKLRGLAHRLLLDDGAVDDVMQEAYLRAFRALPRFRAEASLGTWLYRITSNACMDHLRSRQRRAERQAPADGPEPVWPGEDPAEVASTNGAVFHALRKLNPDQRAVALLVDGDGLNYAEAAVVLHLAPGTVASRLSRARASLRRSLEAA
jgi:RNA polymerase sigma-70 factor (ECF subfamily)